MGKEGQTANVKADMRMDMKADVKLNMRDWRGANSECL